MKKKIISVILSIGLVAGLLAGCGSSAADTSGSAGGEATKIVCATTTGYYPFVFADDDGNLVGYDIELITEVFNRLPQYDLEFELNEWDSILTGLDSGLYQISTECIFYSEDRAEKYYFSDPIFYDPVVAVTSSDHPDVKTFDDMAGETTPARAGSIWALAAESYNDTHADNPIIVDYAESDFFQLFSRASEGDCVLLTDYGMAVGITQDNEFDVKITQMDADYLSQYMDSSYTYFMMSKYGDDSAQLQKDVNEALKSVMEDGTAKAISEKYFGEDLTPSAAK